MNIRRVFFLAIMILASCSDIKKVIDVPEEEFTGELSLSNGLKIYYSVNKTLPEIETSVLIRGGALAIPDSVKGAHLFPYILLNMQGNSDGYVTFDHYSFDDKIPSDKLSDWFEDVKCQLFNPVFTDYGKYVKRAGELYSLQSNEVRGAILSKVLSSFYEMSPLLTGDPHIEDFITFYNRTVVPENTAIIISGSFDPVYLKSIAESVFSTAKAKDSVRYDSALKNRILYNSDYAVIRNTPYYAVSEFRKLPDSVWRYKYESLRIISEMVNILFDGGGYSAIYPVVDGALFMMETGYGEEEGFERARKRILKIKESLVCGSFPEEDIIKIQRRYRFDRIKESERNDGRLKFMKRAFLGREDVQDIIERENIISSLSAEDISGICSEIFKGQDMEIIQIPDGHYSPLKYFSDNGLRSTSDVDINSGRPFFENLDSVSKLIFEGDYDVVAFENKENDRFYVEFISDRGDISDPVLKIASRYFNDCAGDVLSLYGAGVRMTVGECESKIVLEGLSEYFIESLELLDMILSDVEKDVVLFQKNLKVISDERGAEPMILNRMADRFLQGRGVLYGEGLSVREIKNLSFEKIKLSLSEQKGSYRSIYYYGPLSIDSLYNVFAYRYLYDIKDHVTEKMEITDTTKVHYIHSPSDRIALIGFTATTPCRFELVDLPAIELYNRYVGRDIYSLLFSEMVLNRRSAYSAEMQIFEPKDTSSYYTLQARMYTNVSDIDRAIYDFREFISMDLPEEDPYFEEYKTRIVSSFMIEKEYNRENMFFQYHKMKHFGLSENPYEYIAENISSVSYDDIRRVHYEYIQRIKPVIYVVADRTKVTNSL